MKSQIIAQGAEAVISLDNNNIIKNRIKKSYRLSFLDENLRKKRTKSEAKIINKLKAIINVPKIIETKNNEIVMEYIEGKKLSDNLDNLSNKFEIAEQIGEEIAKLHDFNIIHGDLTTSNMILVENKENKINKISTNAKKSFATNNDLKSDLTISEKINSDINNTNNKINFKVYFIDFGLGFHSERIEDKAVDLHLIRQALEAKHFKYWKELFSFIIKGYNSKDKAKVLEQLKKVEARGRYKGH